MSSFLIIPFYCSLTLVNNLIPSTTTKSMNAMRYPNRTNIHTHGLHIDPAVDDVFIHTNGAGDNHTYIYKISPDHAPGIHWYHSHLHGASAMQVMGGLVGALIVQPKDSNTIPATLRAMKRKTLVFTHMMLDGDDSALDPFTCLSYSTLSTNTGSTLPIDPVYLNSSIKDAWFVNGQYQPTNSMSPGEWQIFDMVAASGDRILELEIRTDIGRDRGASACNIRLLALDGVYLSAARSGTYVDHLPMIQAQRASIAVMCDTAGTFLFQTARAASSSDAFFEKISDVEVGSTQVLMILSVSGTSVSMAEPPTDLTTIPKPSYLNDLSAIPISSSSNWSMAFDQSGCCGTDITARFWLGMGQDCSTSLGPCSYLAFPGELGSNPASYRNSFMLNSVHELSLWGKALNAHPIHIHVNHFQIKGFSTTSSSTSYRYFRYDHDISLIFFFSL
jgi:FtsP/CotA-like multicopper oxidase with cupredoxin domain